MLENIAFIWRGQHYQWRDTKSRPSLIALHGLWAGRISMVTHVLWHGVLVFTDSCEELPHFFAALYDMQGDRFTGDLTQILHWNWWQHSNFEVWSPESVKNEPRVVWDLMIWYGRIWRWLSSGMTGVMGCSWRSAEHSNVTLLLWLQHEF